MNSIERNKTYYIQNQFKTLEDTIQRKAAQSASIYTNLRNRALMLCHTRGM